MGNVFRLHVYSQDRSIDKRLEVQGDLVVIGRGHKDSPCDVVIARKDISRVHARLMRGLVIDDLGSTNGTYVDGQRIERATQVFGRSFQIGDPTTENLVTIELENDGVVDDESSAADSAHREAALSDATILDPLARAPVGASRDSRESNAELLEVRGQLEQLEVRFAAERGELAAEIQRLRHDVEAARGAGDSQAVDELQRDNRQLKQRVESLKRDAEERAMSDAQSMQARLALDELAIVRQRAEQLQDELAAAATKLDEVLPAYEQSSRRLAEFESRARAAEVELDRARGDLAAARRSEAMLLEQAEAVRTLRGELEEQRAKQEAAAPKPSGWMSALVERLQKSNEELTHEVARLSAARGAGANSAELFNDLRKENEALKRQVDELRRAPRPSQTADATVDTNAATLRAENERLMRENYQLRVRLPRSTEAAPIKANNTVQFLRALIRDDPGSHFDTSNLAVDEFLITEQYVCFRNVEKVVSRMAAEFLQIYEVHTILPGTNGENYRNLAESLLDGPRDDEKRQEISRYMDEIGKWLAASVQAHRRAASRFVNDLRGELSEAGLTKTKAVRGIGWAVKAELWDRAQNHLRQLSSTSIDERLEQLARDEANSIVHTGTNPGQPGPA